MSQVFLSYSKADHFFAELARIKLEQAGISVWIDQGRLRAGNDWRLGIDQGISESFAILLALSPDSSDSSYVTYEWASAMGRGKPIIPLLLNKCEKHPKLVDIQHLDFSVPGNLPWPALLERVREIEQDNELTEFDQAFEINVEVDDIPDENDPAVDSILGYLNLKGYQIISFDRIRKRINENLSDEDLRAMIANNRRLFRAATIKGGKPGMARI